MGPIMGKCGRKKVANLKEQTWVRHGVVMMKNGVPRTWQYLHLEYLNCRLWFYDDPA